jgi:hypothetical protein
MDATGDSVDLWDVTRPGHPVHSAALGAIDTSGVGGLAPGGDIGSDAAGSLVSVLNTDNSQEAGGLPGNRASVRADVLDLSERIAVTAAAPAGSRRAVDANIERLD